MPARAWHIPDGEWTQSVRAVIGALTRELDSLRAELCRTRHALDEIRRAADLDPMLPVLNRRAFVRAVSRQIAAVGRYAEPASLLYLDLDGFKTVNDTLGHAAGDAALGHFTRALLANTRGSDAVGRLGGDEFGVLLCRATLDQARLKADFLASKLHETPARWNGTAIAIAFSCGAFELDGREGAEHAIARADAEMYAAKHAVREIPLDNFVKRAN